MPHLAKVVLQLQLPALGLTAHKLPALVQALQARLQAVRTVPGASLQQPPASLIQLLHRVHVGHHIVPQHLGDTQSQAHQGRMR